MTSIKNSIPKSISIEAQDFIQQAIDDGGCPNRTVQEIVQGRAAETAKSTPAIEAILRETGAHYIDIDINGVKVMVVTPKDHDAKNNDRGVLYFFGGGFIAGNPYIDLVITAQLATLTGLTFYAPWYPPAPESPYPAALNAGITVYKDLITRMRPGGLSVVGESAGGNLALAVTIEAARLKLPSPNGLALLSPWCDLSQTSESLTTHAGLDPTIPASADDDFAGGAISKAYAGDRDLFDPQISPIYAPYPKTFPPTLITTGTRDFLMSDCARLSTHLRLSGVGVQINVWEGMWHVFEFYPELPEARISLEEISAFLMMR